MMMMMGSMRMSIRGRQAGKADNDEEEDGYVNEYKGQAGRQSR